MANKKTKTVLGEQQAEALDRIRSFLDSEGGDAFCLYGSAGTGKSFMIKRIIELVKKKKMQYCLVAPTHKATLVMTQYTGEMAETLHKLLALSPNLEILKLDLKQLEFQSKSSECIPAHGVVICDEASMINDDLYDIIMEKCSEMGTKVIFCGDIKQLQPVEGRHYSKVFSLDKSFELTKIYRQQDGSALAPLLLGLRDHPIIDIAPAEAEEGSVYVYDDVRAYADKMVECFQDGIKKRDVLYAKALAFTNERVETYNRVLHKLTFGDEPFYKGEILTAYGNFRGKSMQFYNSMDYIIDDKPYTTDAYIGDAGIRMKCHVLRLFDPLMRSSDIVCLLDNNNDDALFQELAECIDNTRLMAISSTGKARSMMWRRYFNMTKSIAFPRDVYLGDRMIIKKSLDYGYAITVHKSQGSSIKNTFVDLKDIRKQKNPDELRQLEYVALSRASGDVFILK